MTVSPQSSTLQEGATLRNAMEALESSPAKIALVVDADGRLRGTLTDGDLRRAILRGGSLDSPVDEAMNRKFLVARASEDRAKLLARMRNNSLRQMPVVDDEGRVIRIETLTERLVAPKPNWVFLMAGGFGKRLRPLTETTPKPMLEVGGKPVLQTILERFIDAGFRRFFISVHYLAEKIKEHFGDGSAWGVEIVYVEETSPLGTAGALSLLPETPDAPLLVMNGDVLTAARFNHLLEFHCDHAAAATMCLREYDFQVPYGTVEVDGPWAIGIVEKPVHKVFVNAGIYVLSPEAVAAVPAGGPLDMPDLLQALIAGGQSVAAYPLHEQWLDIGRPEDFHKAENALRDITA